MTFSSTDLLKQTESHWFCLKAQPKHEHVAAASLRRNMGIECFSPRIRFRKNTRRGPVWFVEAMFPGYLFARFVFAEMHRQVQAAHGVSTIVRFGLRVASIPESTIASLREVGGGEETVVFNPEPQVGDVVQIAEGAFLGLEAVITQVLPAKERVKVLLEFLGRTIEAETTAPKIIPKVSPRAASLGT
jgi:transcription antitermination factor NusG